MILIDSVFVNVGGAKILLEYILTKLASSSEEYFLLLDYRSENNLDIDVHSFKFKYVKGYFERKKFYEENRDKFSKVLCFGNIPPNYKMKDTKVYTYFQQQLFLQVPKNFSFINKFKYFVKVCLLRRLVKNSDQWLVQSSLISDKLSKKFNISKNHITILPFYPPLISDHKFTRLKNTFIYVSDANPHKNHYKLIEAFCLFYDHYKIGSLTLTIPEYAHELIEFIKIKTDLKYPIINIGFIKRNDLYEYYNTYEFLIFPSLAESFGLGLVEAIDCGCKVIAADLPYTYQVCKPSLVFNPFSLQDIYNTLVKTQNLDSIPISEKSITNNIDLLLNLLEK